MSYSGMIEKADTFNTAYKNKIKTKMFKSCHKVLKSDTLDNRYARQNTFNK